MSTLFPNLPAPQIIEPLDYETILAEMIVDLNARFVTSGISYDVGNLETDPLVIALEVAAYREVNLRARVNDVARAQILSFSTGSDLDHLASFYGVVRLTNEEDAALQVRVQTAIAGRSTAGPEHWYKYHALSADARVKDVSVSLNGLGPSLTITILSADNGGVADQALLDAVSVALNADGVRVTSDVLNVLPAVPTTTNITADVYLIAGQPVSVFNSLEATLRAAWAAEQSIGFDLNASWVTKTLHQTGVQRVVITGSTLPAVADPTHAISIGTVTLTFKGHDF